MLHCYCVVIVNLIECKQEMCFWFSFQILHLKYFFSLFVVDIDECVSRPGFCRNGTCENLEGDFRCHCIKGFILSESRDCEGNIVLDFNPFVF